MSEQFLDQAQGQMGAIERLLKGLPGIQGYVDKETRRDADRRVRMLIAEQLEADKQQLFDVQMQLAKGGLKYLGDVDQSVQKLQILIDRVKTASYGYAGLFDTVRIREEQLDALRRFDVAMARRAGEIDVAVKELAAAASGGDPQAAIDALGAKVAELSRLYDRRHEAVVAPDLLLDSGYAPAEETTG